MKRIALAALATAVAAAIAVPAAVATRPDDRDGARGPGAVLVVEKTTSIAPTHPDDRAGPRGPGPGTAASSGAATVDGFDWRDAGVGLAGGLVVALVAAGAAVTLSQRHQAQRLA